MSRRELIRNAGIAGAAAWTAPAIIDSLTSPAAAVSPGSGVSGLSFIVVVFDYNGVRYMIRVEDNSNTCTTNSLNIGGPADTVANIGTCSGTTFGISAGKDLTSTGIPVVPYGATNPPCGTLLAFNGNTVTADGAPGATLVFALAHDGSLGSGCNTAGGTVVNAYSIRCAPGGASVALTCS